MLLVSTSLTYEIHFCRKKEKESFFFPLHKRDNFFSFLSKELKKKIFPDFCSVHTCNTD